MISSCTSLIFCRILWNVGPAFRPSRPIRNLKKADVYLCDEISSALDPENQQLVAELLSELSQRSIVIAVSHHQDAGSLDTITEYNGRNSPVRISRLRSIQELSLAVT
ncbi:hypothetical protein C2I18_06215 [Paenibacillus sp. PK3_47]|nr:hypothetical protein C2I18_06215 [Paenibacillus sp. PK3_47]